MRTYIIIGALLIAHSISPIRDVPMQLATGLTIIIMAGIMMDIVEFIITLSRRGE